MLLKKSVPPNAFGAPVCPPPPSPDDGAAVAQREAEPRRGRDGPRRRGSRGWGERGAVLRPHAETRGGVLLAGQDPGGLLHHQQGGATRVEAVHT